MRRAVPNRIVRAHVVQRTTENGSDAFHGGSRLGFGIPRLLDQLARHGRPTLGYSRSFLLLYNLIEIIPNTVSLKGVFEREHFPQEYTI